LIGITFGRDRLEIMRLLRLADVESRTGDLVFYYSRAWALLVVLTIMGASAPFRPIKLASAVDKRWPVYQFRSYLNYHLREEDLTVAFVSYQEIRCAKLVRERTKVPDMEGGTVVQHARWLELDLVGGPAPWAEALASEVARPAPRERRWSGNTSTLYRHSPVRMASPQYLRMQWSVVPGAAKFLEARRM
jgi:hypothetical protein